MKTLLLSALGMLFCIGVNAQGYMVVNSEKIFKEVPQYVSALSTLEQLTKDYQAKIDAAYQDIEKMYNDYMVQKAQLSASSRQMREDAIINKEKSVEKYQQDIFGPEGELMKKRVELIKPIQDKVFAIITDFAKNNNFGLVLDIATDPSVLYYSPQSDKTEDIIRLTKQQ